ncbi:hypothetical protein JHD50_12360 [Sulfurimonas sp. MAG313]|nr:hypothetical protein [Sulfurimonas sp. MAG313]MDF1882081.1 hypothetical protein [Sulfurimonas sp. MAG313]
MKYLLILTILCVLNLQADYVKKTTAVCKTKQMVIDLREYSGASLEAKDPLELELWLLSHECKIITKKVAIEVLDYTGKEIEVIKIRLKKSGEVVYTYGQAIQIEQHGQNDIIYKF